MVLFTVLLMFRTEEIKLIIIRLTDPLLLSCSIYGSRHVTDVNFAVGVPVLISNDLISDPEPEAQSAGVAQPQPDKRSGGVFCLFLEPHLLLAVGDGNQILVFLSAVIKGFLPGFVFLDQDHVICHHKTQRALSLCCAL